MTRSRTDRTPRGAESSAENMKPVSAGSKKSVSAKSSAENMKPVSSGSAKYSSAKSSRRAAYGGLLAAIALIFSYVEVLVPFGFGIPGIKLGLANIAVLLAIYLLGPAAGAVVNVIRIAMAALLFGSMYSAVYSLAGGLLSLTAMILLRRSGKFRVAGVSLAGGFFHNLGQLAAAMVFSGTPRIFYYLPVLGISGILTGAINGVIAALVLEKLGRRT